MKTDNAIRLVRVSYWTGIIVDALAALQMLVPGLFAFANRLPSFAPGPDYAYATQTGASLMLGWTVLLAWADRKPLERSGILLITIFPVITGLVIAEIVAVQAHFLSVGSLVPIWVLQAALIVLFAYSYLAAKRAGQSPT